MHIHMYLKHPFSNTILKIYICWVIVADTSLQNICGKVLEDLNGLDKMFPKIYICWGIVGDTNFTNFHHLGPFLGKCSENLDGLIFTNFPTNFTNFIAYY